MRRGRGHRRGAGGDCRRQAATSRFRGQRRAGVGSRPRLRRQDRDFCRARRMKTRYLDAVLAANKEGRSVALATDLKSGAQLFLDGEEREGTFELDEVSLGAMREALRVGRNISLDTADGRVF